MIKWIVVLGKLTNKIGQKILARDKQSSLFLVWLKDGAERKKNIITPSNFWV